MTVSGAAKSGGSWSCYKVKNRQQFSWSERGTFTASTMVDRLGKVRRFSVSSLLGGTNEVDDRFSSCPSSIVARDTLAFLPGGRVDDDVPCNLCLKSGSGGSMRSSACRFVSELRLFFHWSSELLSKIMLLTTLDIAQ